MMLKHKLMMLPVLLVLSFAGYAQTYPGLADFSNATYRNYVRSYVPQQPTSTSTDVILNSPTVQSTINTAYLDGLGRPLQEVAKTACGGILADMVQVHVYDAAGREAYHYLPYAADEGLGQGNRGKLKTQPLTQLSAAFNAIYPGEPPYSQNDFDNSPLNRVVNTYAPGNSWVGSGRAANSDYGSNDANTVGWYTIGPNKTDLPVFNNFYNGGELMRQTVTDEDGNITETYTNKTGQVVCKRSQLQHLSVNIPEQWAQTYYVYDDMNHLRYVISPEAINQSIIANGDYNWPVSQQLADGLCYRYWYDGRGRMTEKQLPGKQVEYMVYDNRNRLVLHQDGNERASYYTWDFITYDDLDRPVMTGEYLAPNAATQADLASWLADGNGPNNNDPGYLMYYISGIAGQSAYPTDFPGQLPNFTSSLMLNDGWAHTLNYYDDYTRSAVFTASYSYTSAYNAFLTGMQPYAALPALSNHTRGLLTCKVVSGILSPQPPYDDRQVLVTVNYYDDKARLIQQQADNLKVGGGDIITNQYDFAGTLVSSVTFHQNPYAISPDPAYPDLHKTELIVKKYTKNYVNGLITKTEQNINNTGWRTISSLAYDNLNRVKNKDFSAANNSYTYNIRGWLTGINPAYVNKQQVTQTPDAVMFCEQLAYDDGGLYNGNIASMQWRNSGISATTRRYDYTYDPLNRLVDAQFKELLNTGAWLWQLGDNDFTATNISYDYNGNLQTMNQRGPGLSGPVDMDNLVYHYFPNSNQPKGVYEAQGAQPVTMAPDFKDDPANSDDDYQYDPNGNLTIDKNKSITRVAYNYQNKPVDIGSSANGWIDYVYDGAGNKLRKIVSDYAAGTITTTDYLGNFVYENNKLQLMLHEEGRCRPQATATTAGTAAFDYDFFLKDHLGNVRTVINSQASSGGSYSSTSLTGVAMSKEYRTGMEIASANTDALVWTHLDDVRDAKPGSTNPQDMKAAQLDGTNPNRMTGPSIMLRVMPGDRFELSSNTYYDAVGNDQMLDGGDMLAALASTLAGGSTHTGISVAEVPENVDVIHGCLGNGELPNLLDNLMAQNYDESKPASYLGYLVFDEHMQLLPDQSGMLQMGGAGGQWNTLATNGQVTIGQPGYVTIFTSTRVRSTTYFDNVDVTFYKGSVLEENHYYPFGLTLTSSTNNNTEKNTKKYNGIELDRDLGIETYEAYYRNLDPQTGHWWQVDPESEGMEAWSPYASNYDNPISYSDHLGDAPEDGVGETIVNFLVFTGGNSAAIIDNATGLQTKQIFQPSNPSSSVANAWNAGVATGNAVSFVAGAAGTTGGGPTAEASAAALPETGGLSAIPMVVGAVGQVLGPVLLVNSVRNMSSGAGTVSSSGSSGSSSGGGTTKNANKLEPDKDAVGDHTTLKRDKDGNVYKYQEWKANDKNPSGFDAGKRYDGGKADGTPGAPHINKATKQPIPTPHVQSKDIPGGARAANPNEIPRKH
ncbi:DUF6443 domain-containing protein [Chitinophagaceae bacterium MMS25-I14]